MAKISHEKKSAANASVATLKPGQWCIDTQGDYWHRVREENECRFVCLFKGGNSCVCDDASVFTIAEILPPGTKITIEV